MGFHEHVGFQQVVPNSSHLWAPEGLCVWLASSSCSQTSPLPLPLSLFAASVFRSHLKMHLLEPGFKPRAFVFVDLSLPLHPGPGDDLHSELITGLEISVVLAPCDLWFGGDTEQKKGYTPPSSRYEHVCM